jgi:hypothetical protein
VIGKLAGIILYENWSRPSQQYPGIKGFRNGQWHLNIKLNEYENEKDFMGSRDADGTDGLQEQCEGNGRNH